MHISEPSFKLVDEDGNAIEDANGIRGLLIYNGGTVCDDSYGDSEADVICQEMGYDRSSDWTSGYFYKELQNSLDITLDDVSCEGRSWSSCEYSTTENCGHSEDVFLTCVTGETFRYKSPSLYHSWCSRSQVLSLLIFTSFKYIVSSQS